LITESQNPCLCASSPEIKAPSESIQHILVETKSDLKSDGGVSGEQIKQFKKEN